MTTKSEYPHLTIETDGTARIGNTRYKVIHLAAEHYQHGWTAEELLRQHADLRPEEVYSALAYFYDHYDRLIGEMKLSFAAAEVARPSQPVSRNELLRRKTVTGIDRSRVRGTNLCSPVRVGDRRDDRGP